MERSQYQKAVVPAIFCWGVHVNEGTFTAKGDLEAPWENETFETVVLGRGITTVSSNSFGGFEELEKLVVQGEDVFVEHCAFYGYKNLKEIKGFDKISRFDSHAFYGCSSLTSLIFGGNVTLLDDREFADCTGLKEVCFSASFSDTTQINKSFYTRFDGCSSSEKIVVDEENLVYASQDGVL